MIGDGLSPILSNEYLRTNDRKSTIKKTQWLHLHSASRLAEFLNLCFSEQLQILIQYYFVVKYFLI